MPHKDPAAAKAYFAARYQARKDAWNAKRRAALAAETSEQAEFRRAARRGRRRAEETPEQRENRLASNRRSQLRRLYGVTEEKFEQMWALQAGMCAVCERELTRTRTGATAACVDHNHTTGQVRGLLCRTCNTAVGYIEKDTTRAIRSADYLLARDEAYRTLDTDPPAG